MSSTLAEKIMARATGRESVSAGEFVVADIDLAMVHDIFAASVFDKLAELGRGEVFDADKAVVVVDHLVPAPSAEAAALHQSIRRHVARLGIDAFYDAGEGISHQLLPERGHIRPGMLVVGSDSHTTTYGALGAAITGSRRFLERRHLVPGRPLRLRQRPISGDGVRRTGIRRGRHVESTHRLQHGR